MIISLSGAPGSGKSTIAKRLAEELGWPRYYIGGLRRQKAQERGMTLAEYNKLGETDPSTDLEVDRYQEELGKKEDNFIIEGRTSWYFIPQSLKFYIDVDEEEGAKRIWSEMEGENERNEGGPKTLDELIESLRERIRSDEKRYRKYFGINAFNKDNFDHIIDTTDLNPEEAYQETLKIIKKYL
jgi:cytidylate kinase